MARVKRSGGTASYTSGSKMPDVGRTLKPMVEKRKPLESVNGGEIDARIVRAASGQVYGRITERAADRIADRVDPTNGFIDLSRAVDYFERLRPRQKSPPPSTPKIRLAYGRLVKV